MPSKCTVCGRELYQVEMIHMADTTSVCKPCLNEMVKQGLARAQAPVQDRIMSDFLCMLHTFATKYNYNELIENVEECLSLFFDNDGNIGRYIGMKDMAISYKPHNQFSHTSCPLYLECKAPCPEKMEDCGPLQDRLSEEEAERRHTEEIEDLDTTLYDPDETMPKKDSGCPIAETCKEERCPVYTCDILCKWEDEQSDLQYELEEISKMARKEDR